MGNLMEQPTLYEKLSRIADNSTSKKLSKWDIIILSLVILAGGKIEIENAMYTHYDMHLWLDEDWNETDNFITVVNRLAKEGYISVPDGWENTPMDGTYYIELNNGNL